MPYFDGTGPMGYGPMTGRGMGPCAGYYPRGYGRGFGRGHGRGWGRGFGRGFFWQKPLSKEEELEDMRLYKKDLEQELSELEKEISQMEK